MRGICGIAVLGLACDRRVPVLAEDDPLFAYELPQTGRECGADVGCERNGCGQYCTAATEEDFVSTCEWPAALDDAECGCVREQCVWYTVEPAELPTGWEVGPRG